MTTQEAPAPVAGGTRQLLYIGVGIVALVIVSVAIVVLVGRGAAQEFPADSPEGAFQRYLTAFDEGDYDTAYDYFSDRVKDGTSLDEYRRNAQMYGGGFGMGIPGQSRRVLIQGRDEDGDRVRLQLVIEYFYEGGPFGGGGSFQEARSVTLVRESGEWRLDELLFGVDPGPMFAPEF